MATVQFKFGPVRQETSSKQLRTGDLVEALNVRQTAAAGVYSKRRGFSRTAMTFSGGTLSGAPASLLPGKAGTGALMRDTGDQLWSWSGTGTAWQYRGSHRRAWLKANTIDPNLYSAPQPCQCAVGANIWTFALTTNAYYLTVTDAATGAIVLAPTRVAARQPTSFNSICHAAAVYDGTNVWLFWVSNDVYIMSHKFVVATPSVAPTQTVYYTLGVSKLQQVAALYVSTRALTLVAFAGVSATDQIVGHTILDTATGAAKTSPAAGIVVNNPGTKPMQALGFLAGQDGSATNIYYHYYGFQPGGSGATYTGPVIVSITSTSTLAFTVGLGLSTVGGATDAITAAGYCLDVNYQHILWTKQNGYVWMSFHYLGLGDITAFTWTYRGFWLASGFAKIGNDWYCVTGYDDISTSAAPTGTAVVTTSTQQTYHARILSTLSGGGSWYWGADIVGHVLNGAGAGQFHTASSTAPVATQAVTTTPVLLASGTKLIAAVAANAGVTGSVGISRIEVETAKVWGSDCRALDRGFSPGSIPITWSQSNNAHEISPLLYPSYIVQHTAGAGSDFAIAAAVYVIRDADGTLWRSTPAILNATIGNGAVLYIPSLQHMLGTGLSPSLMSRVQIEVYLGTSANAKLQTVIDNPNTWSDPNLLSYVSYTTPTAATMVNGETLYTTGNSLTQAWPPQCQSMASWRNRVFLADRNRIWYSTEFSEGLGTLFNEVMISQWDDCDGNITGMSALDWNYFCIFGTSSIGVISGPGPNAVGTGTYTVQTLSTKMGLANGSPCISGPTGCYFQDVNTGRLATVTPSLQAVECAGGAYAYSGSTVVAVAYYEQERMLLFYLPAGAGVVAMDFQHAADVAPFGQVFLWTSAGALDAVAATTVSTGIVHITATGDLYAPADVFVDGHSSGVSQSYRESLTLGNLQPSELQGEFSVSRVQVLGTFRAACSVKLTTYPDYAVSGTATTPLAIAAAPFQVMTRPPNCLRIQALGIKIEETAGSGTEQAFDFEGIAMEYQPRGRIKHLNTSQVVS